MNNETKLTAADLALYLGCVVYAEKPTASGTVYVRRGRFVGIRPTETGRINPITVDIETESGGVIDMYFLPEQVKPILRPLSDMTEEEEKATQAIVNEIGFGYELGASITRYLLSRHLDLFGWIDAGLAIDKTKTTQP